MRLLGEREHEAFKIKFRGYAGLIMKKSTSFVFSLFIAALLTGPFDAAAAEPRAAEILKRLAAEFRAMPAYGVTFEIASGDYAARGSYAVEGSAYYLTLGDAEVFADGATRYEVDNRRREVTIDKVDTASRNILNNPVRAFDFLGNQYTAALLSERDGRAVVCLTPTGGASADSSVGNITLTVDTASMRPLWLAYDFDGDRIDIAVSGVAPLSDSFRRFDSAAYKGYELIDFR